MIYDTITVFAKSTVIVIFTISLGMIIGDFLAAYSFHRTNPITQYRIKKRAKSNIERFVKGLIKYDWYITKMRRSSVERISSERYKIFVEIKTNNPKHFTGWLVDYVEIDTSGNILKEDLTKFNEAFNKISTRKVKTK